MIKFICLLFCCTVVTAAPIKVALIGNANTVDLATAELANDKNIELLERSEITRVLNEHRLTATLSNAEMRKHFPHVDVFAVFSAERLVVFNAKNGFRLLDGKPDNPAENVRMAVNKISVANPVYLSIVTVRDVGVPRRLKPKIEEFVTALEQGLIKSPSIQMLERNRLGTVAHERELSGTSFALTPSALLIALEFEPGSEAHIVNVKLSLNELSGKKLGLIVCDNAFNNLVLSVQNTQNELNNLLFQSQKPLEDSQREAERYFQDALKNYKSNKTAAWDKLNAALSLDPKNLDYQEKALEWKFWALGWTNNTLQEHVDILNQTLDIDIKRDKFSQWHNNQRYMGNGILTLLSKSHTTDTEKKNYRKFLARLRKYLFEYEFKNKNIEKIPTSFPELDNHYFYHSGMRSSVFLYYDAEAYRLDKLRGEVDFLKITDRFMRDYPNLTNNKNFDAWLISRIRRNYHEALTCSGNAIYEEHPRYTLRELSPYLKIAKKHTCKRIQATGLVAELWARTVNSQGDPKVFHKNFATFAENFAALNLSASDRAIKENMWDNFFNILPDNLRVIVKEYGKTNLSEWCLDPESLFLLPLDLSKTPAEAVAFLESLNRDTLQQYEREIRRRYSLFNRLLQVEDSAADPYIKKALDILNYGMRFKEIAMRPDDGFSDGAANGDLLYMVSRTSNGIDIQLLNSKTDEISSFLCFKTTYKEFSRTYRTQFSNSYALDCDGKTLLIGTYGAFHLIDIAAKTVTTISDIPDESINSAMLLDNRVYLWCGYRSNNSGTGNVLFSCNYQGGDRKFHYNGKTEERDKAFPSNVRGMIADREKNRILILNWGELWEYYPEKHLWKTIVKRPDISNANWESVLMQRDKANVALTFSMEFMTFNPKNDQSEWFFCGLPRDKYKNEAKYFYKEEKNPFVFQGPFLVQGKYLWILDTTLVRCLDTAKDPVREICFYIPFDMKILGGTFRIFPASDGISVYFQSCRRIVKLTPTGE